MKKTIRIIGIVAAVLLGLGRPFVSRRPSGPAAGKLLCLQQAGGMAGLEEIQPPSGNILTCVQATFTLSGLKAMGILLLIAGGLTAYFKFSDRFGGSGQDPGALPSARRAPTAPPPGWGRES